MGNKRFPLFLDLAGRPVVILGGGTVGLRRAEVLRRFGAEVTVIAPRLQRSLEDIRYIPRCYRTGDLSGAFLALAATDDPEVNAAAGREARERGILFNRSDCPAACDFFFPAVCEGGGMIAGLVGDGASHRRTAEAARQIRGTLAAYETNGGYPMKLIIGSRASQLAVIQSELVMNAIACAHPDIVPELLTLKTTGDRILDRPLDKIGGKGLFVQELDAALREGRADLAVHSCKDLPAEIPPDLPLAAFTRREDPRDALVLPEGVDELRGPIGCSSLRRRLQLEALYPDIPTVPIRGNVVTRLQKLDRGEFGALVLAAAGLKRLHLDHRICRYFTLEEMLPAAGQGILAVQCRSGMDTSFLDCVRDADAALCARAERAFIRALDGGCSSPVAAHAIVRGAELLVHGLYVDECGKISRGTVRGPSEQGETLAETLAKKLKEDAV